MLAFKTLYSAILLANKPVSTKVMKVIRRLHIRLHIAEKSCGTPQNHIAETEIREVKTKWKARMRKNNVPSRLWDYGLVCISEIQSLLAHGNNQRPGTERIMGQTIDISEWLVRLCLLRLGLVLGPTKDGRDGEQAQLGRWLGIAYRVGSDMTYWILTNAGRVMG